jgi:predicted permease
LLDDIGRDVRQSLRLLARQRTFTAVIVVTLALGIGANTAIFSIVDSLLLRTLPVKDPNRLAVLSAGPQTTWTYPIWEEIQRREDLFDGVFAWSRFDAQFNLSQGGETQFVSGVWASASSFTILGVRPILGRTFVPADDVRGGGPAGPVAVISYGFWQRHFAGARDVVGRTLMLDRVPFTIVGVTPREFFGLTPGRSFEVAIPLGAEPLVRGSASRLDRRTSWWLAVMVRLKRGQTVDDATTALRGLQPQIRAATLPATRSDRYLREPFTFEAAATGRSGLRNEYQRPLMVILVVVGLVLLIACTNIANLLLARATARSHEWSVRLALGASRGRLARQLLIESLLLAAAGAAAGLVVAQWASELLVAQLAADLDLSLDWRVLAFTAAAACLAALVFGVAPALRAARGVPIDAMKDRGRSNAAGGRITAANGLVLAQVVLSVVLVVCAGLFLRTFSGLVQVPLGFDRDRVLVTEIDARRADLTPEAQLATYGRIRERVLGVPGVSAAGISIIAPLSGRLWSRRVEVSGSNRPRNADVDGPEGMGYTDRAIPENGPLAIFNAITPGWIATYGTPLLAGRDLSDRDGPASPRVALVNQAFARKFLDGANPVGHTVQPTRDPGLPVIDIVGLVSDTAFRNVREPVLPIVYVPLAQASDDPQIPHSEVSLSVRADSSAPEALSKTVAAAVSEINPTLPLTSYSLADQVNESLVQERLLAILSAAFGTLALVMAAVGLYGVTSYAVNLRRSEIGIRMALGATRAVVMRLVLARVSLLVGAGITVGLALAAWASRFVTSLLYGLEPGDPITFAVAAVTLAVIGAVAGWIPAHRASRLDPTEVLSDV